MSYGPSGGQPPYGSGGYGSPPPQQPPQGPPPPPPGGGGYGGPSGGYGPPPPPGDPYGGGNYGQPPASKGSAIGALVANIFGICLNCLFGIVGLILAIIALNQIESNPKSARMLTLISWICFGVGAVIGIFAWIFVYPDMFATNTMP
ncbi:DUF4190 domain-containing protein [Streptomonospora litoralis]|uniref:DUF4190 domain-containing protein n=1 Tax=Streptomonospora litoralis TaxID=2498135 RepID=A0A4V0ZJP8_9ACTN|nr:DUF4190 domain-containing protein [Streptomonospora litoralis]QBI54232.1 hypothetical protein EKD16_12245 [Streptomonospora litoralis]